MAKKKLNFREFWDAVGTENIERIINDLGSSIEYFRMLRYGVKKPGRQQALLILKSARRHCSPYEPDLELLLEGVPRVGTSPIKQLPPATEFLRARKKLLATQDAQPNQ